MKNRPYFLENKKWYIENKEWYINGVPYFLVKGAKKPKENQYILTEKAPQKAIESYKEYYDL